ncbi:MAG: hypothetical protein GWM98_11590 [Nitrospinaceae bacterium]|nr:hypothetical protein [Nitrospinaceae bacterium]NIR55026.1 hypothetical protein [Nitrospinaceae bacterium]NIS85425.1 hypothetical protein [Nitrospinaceae bacterium]NIT82264.1 hypothetical protein [Nitrospinaceae bacterium]NIU44494.1 hypothetical protein [Nitrospinaceae bacterium]
MDFLSKFTDQSWFVIAGEVTLFANTITAALPSRWYKKDGQERIWYKWLMKGLNFLSINVFRNKNADDK